MRRKERVPVSDYMSAPYLRHENTVGTIPDTSGPVLVSEPGRRTAMSTSIVAIIAIILAAACGTGAVALMAPTQPQYHMDGGIS